MAKAKKKAAKKKAAKSKSSRGAPRLKPGEVREGTNIAKAISKMQRAKGVSLDELQEDLGISQAGARSLVNDVKNKGKKVSRDGKKYKVAA